MPDPRADHDFEDNFEEEDDFEEEDAEAVFAAEEDAEPVVASEAAAVVRDHRYVGKAVHTRLFLTGYMLISCIKFLQHLCRNVKWC